MLYNQGVLWDKSFLELIGAIFVRSQIIEEIMRALIREKLGHELPANFDRMTFGGLLSKLADVYPEIKISPPPPEYGDLSLYSDLLNAKNVRDDAAHGDYISHLNAVKLMTSDKQGAVDRLTVKAARKSALAMDDALFKLSEFARNHLKPEAKD